MHACGMAVWPHLPTPGTHHTVVDNWPYRNQIVEISPVNSSSDTEHLRADRLFNLADGKHLMVKCLVSLFNYWGLQINRGAVHLWVLSLIDKSLFAILRFNFTHDGFITSQQ